MTYMVQQLLTFSRIESNTEFLTKQNTMVSREVVHVIAELNRRHIRNRLLWSLLRIMPYRLSVNGPLVAILIRNIIDNAIEYFPSQRQCIDNCGGQRNIYDLC